MLCHHHLLDSLPPQGSVQSLCFSSNLTFIPTSGSSLNISREAADPREEESPWLLQGEEADTGYNGVELSALETSIVTFP